MTVSDTVRVIRLPTRAESVTTLTSTPSSIVDGVPGPIASLPQTANTNGISNSDKPAAIRIAAGAANLRERALIACKNPYIAEKGRTKQRNRRATFVQHDLRLPSQFALGV